MFTTASAKKTISSTVEHMVQNAMLETSQTQPARMAFVKQQHAVQVIMFITIHVKQTPRRTAARMVPDAMCQMPPIHVLMANVPLNAKTDMM